MTFNQRQFRDALSLFATGITVVTTHGEDGVDAGITANSFNSVSLDPPLILWSIGHDSGSFQTFESCEHFAVHILTVDQTDLSQRFASLGANKFANLKTVRGLGNVPLLSECAARFECSVFKRVPAGDHTIYIGKVERLTSDPRHPPLIYHGGKYSALKDVAPIT
ncbi:MAG: flavin reductase family protein [Pseudomonadota bacterium]